MRAPSEVIFEHDNEDESAKSDDEDESDSDPETQIARHKDDGPLPLPPLFSNTP
jgi:hypothetical protein